MEEEINYLDLLVLKKIDAESSVERFGSHINTSFFETANLLGGMKIKGLIDIQSAIGGQSPIVITGCGTDIIAEAERKYAEPLDTLDQAILHTLASGVRDLQGLSSMINIRPRDLAFHLYKLKAGDYIEHEVRSAKVSFSLTEKGFNLVGVVRAVGPGMPPMGGATGRTANVPAQPARSPAGGMGMAGAANIPAQPVKSAGARLAGDDEINDILNFGGVTKKEAPGGKLEQKTPAGMAPAGARTWTPGTTDGSAKGAAGGPSQGASGSFAQGAAGGPSQGASGSFAQGASMSSAEAQKRIPEFARPQPAQRAASVKELDRQQMFASKLEYYVKEYFVYCVLLVLLVLIVLAAIVFALITRSV